MKARAQRIHQFGSPDVIVFEDVDLPAPGPDEALLAVRAASVGPWDALVRTGNSGLPQPLPLTLGSDLSGTVLEIGTDGTHLTTGAEVFGVTNARFVNAYATHAIVDADRLALRPASIDANAAAALPVVAVTAYKMLFELGRLQRGQRVLVHGAAGNVGGLAVQMAHDAGAAVIALGGAGDASVLRDLGADETGDYKQTFESAFAPVDLVIDTIGGEIQTRSYEMLKPGGALISSVKPPDQQTAAAAKVRAEFFIVDVRTSDLDRISALVLAGTITPNVGLVLPLSEARRAHELMANHEPARGKIVLTAGT